MDIVSNIYRIGTNLVQMMIDFGRALFVPINELNGGVILGGYNLIGSDLVLGPLFNGLMSLLGIDLDTITMLEFIPVIMLTCSLAFLIGRIVDSIIDWFPDIGG